MRREPVPSYSIGDVLRYLGAEDVPTGRGWLRMRCVSPAHADRTPSAAVNHDVNGYACFPCELSGDGLKLVMILEGVTFREALRICEEVAGGTRRQVPATSWPSDSLLG